MENKVKLIAMDLDGTLTQHRSPLSDTQRAVLDALGKRYKLLMVGAGRMQRIFEQMEHYPVDIIGNYGLQYGVYHPETKNMELVRDEVLPCDRESVSARVEALRQKYGFLEYAGESVEFHPSGAVTIPLIGTKAKIEDKLAFDPDRAKRKVMFSEVKELFPEFTVFLGGSSSFDMAPKPFDKYHALCLYCREQGLAHENVVYIGDDYGPGGNDEPVYRSDFPFITVDNYLDFPQRVAHLLK